MKDENENRNLHQCQPGLAARLPAFSSVLQSRNTISNRNEPQPDREQNPEDNPALSVRQAGKVTNEIGIKINLAFSRIHFTTHNRSL